LPAGSGDAERAAFGRHELGTGLGLESGGAQARPGAATGETPVPTMPLPGQVERVVLTAGRSTVLRTDFEITRIAVTNPAVADAIVVQNREILVDGKTPGTISLIVWSATDRKHYDLVVEPAITTLQQQLRALFLANIVVSATDGPSSSGRGVDEQRRARGGSRRPVRPRSRSSTCCSS
jgi:Flp pilus assembly secretin CpaC